MRFSDQAKKALLVLRSWYLADPHYISLTRLRTLPINKIPNLIRLERELERRSPGSRFNRDSLRRTLTQLESRDLVKRVMVRRGYVYSVTQMCLGKAEEIRKEVLEYLIDRSNYL